MRITDWRNRTFSNSSSSFGYGNYRTAGSNEGTSTLQTGSIQNKTYSVSSYTEKKRHTWSKLLYLCAKQNCVVSYHSETNYITDERHLVKQNTNCDEKKGPHFLEICKEADSLPHLSDCGIPRLHCLHCKTMLELYPCSWAKTLSCESNVFYVPWTSIST